MSTNDKTRYYWLKLNKDFFQKHQIRVIEGMKNGKEYVLFYLKITVEATAWKGELRFSEMIPYSEEMLANLTNTPIDTVHAALEIFRQLGLIEVWDDGTLYIKEVERITGSETGQTIRKREVKEEKDQLGYDEGNNGVKRTQEIRDKRLEYRDKSNVTTSTTLHSVDSVTKDKTRYNKIKAKSLCQALVSCRFILEDELQDSQWGDLLDDYIIKYGYVDTKIKLTYVLDAVCVYELGVDEYGKYIHTKVYDPIAHPIESKFIYLKSSMNKAFKRKDIDNSAMRMIMDQYDFGGDSDE